MCGPFSMPVEFLKTSWKDAMSKITEYHIHMYFDDAYEGLEIRVLTEDLEKMFPDAVTGVYDVKVVGPHTKKNIEINIKPQNFGEIVQWLQMNAGKFSILVHPNTGDDVKDHLETALWIGRETPMNMDFFDRLKARHAKKFVP